MSTGKVWIVSLNDANDLQITSTADTIGEFTLEFYLIGSGNKLLAKDDVAVRLAPSQSVDIVNAILDPPDKADAETETGAAETSLTLPPLPADEEEVLLRRSEELMREGGIAAARLIYEELANRGSGRAALALAQTYDPAFIPPSATSAVKPDVETALKWYERAAIYGSDEARQRIAVLSAGG
jgi:TPR repeat protein